MTLLLTLVLALFFGAGTAFGMTLVYFFRRDALATAAAVSGDAPHSDPHMTVVLDTMDSVGSFILPELDCGRAYAPVLTPPSLTMLSPSAILLTSDDDTLVLEAL